MAKPFDLVSPLRVLEYLEEASSCLSQAHLMAAEQEGDRKDLIGPVRDTIFGLNSALTALISMIQAAEDD